MLAGWDFQFRKRRMNFKIFLDFLKNKYIILAFLTLVALFVRLLNIDKPYGLWYDEMLTYSFSLGSFPMGLIKTLSRFDFHMPLYYVYAHFWMKFFGSSDVVLRYSSLIWGTLCIPAFFYLGKTYKSEKTGYFLAAIGCLNPILIYFSQEFRFYSILIFFSTLTFISVLEIVENPQKKYFWMFGISNLIILYIYTMGLIFVSFEFLALFIHFYFFKKGSLKTFLRFFAIFFVLATPYLGLLYNYSIASSKLIIYPFDFSQPDVYSVISLINDWFSPFLTNQYGLSAKTYETYMKNAHLSFMLYVFSAVSVCFTIGFISGIKRIDKKLAYLLVILFGFLGAETILALTGHLTVYTKYTLICFPIILLISTDGLLTLKAQKLKKVLFFIIFLTYVLNVIDYKRMPAFALRANGYKILTDKIEEENPTKNDCVLYTGGRILIQKYLNDTNIMDFDLLSAVLLDKKKDYAYKIFDKNFVLTTNKNNVYEKLAPLIENPKPTKTMERYVNSQINKIPKGGRLILAEDAFPGSLSQNQLEKIMQIKKEDKEVEKAYKKQIFIVLTNKINNDVLLIADNNKSLKFIHKTLAKGPGTKNRKWFVFVYKKI